MLEIFNTQILPACLEYQKDFAKSIAKIEEFISKFQKKRLASLNLLIEKSIETADELEIAQIRDFKSVAHTGTINNKVPSD